MRRKTCPICKKPLTGGVEDLAHALVGHGPLYTTKRRRRKGVLEALGVLHRRLEKLGHDEAVVHSVMAEMTDALRRAGVL